MMAAKRRRLGAVSPPPRVASCPEKGANAVAFAERKARFPTVPRRGASCENVQIAFFVQGNNTD